MPGDPRPSLEDAARAWLDQGSRPAGRAAQLEAALDDFVNRRFRGAAADVRAVHDLRQSLLDDGRNIASLHPEGAQRWDDSSVGQAASDSSPPDQGRLLFSLVRVLRPRSVLELGTNIGISAAYIRLGLRYGGQGSLTTVDASGARLELARRNFDTLGLDHPDWVEGRFDDVVPSLLTTVRPLDLVFIDGNHKRDPTLSYFRLFADEMGPGGVMVFDDIRWSTGMVEAWSKISSSESVSTVVDLGRTGIVVVR